jgi:hypothetical protein
VTQRLDELTTGEARLNHQNDQECTSRKFEKYLRHPVTAFQLRATAPIQHVWRQPCVSRPRITRVWRQRCVMGSGAWASEVGAPHSAQGRRVSPAP